jgi:hypothetical protein
MANAKAALAILLSMALIFSIVFFSGCIGQVTNSNIPPSPYLPGVRFSMSSGSVSVKSNSTSGIVTVNVIKDDTYGIATPFEVRLSSSSPLYIYPLSVTGSQQMMLVAQTQALIDSGASDTVQFKVFGLLPQGFSGVTGNITATLLYNGTALPSVAPISIDVAVTK